MCILGAILRIYMYWINIYKVFILNVLDAGCLQVIQMSNYFVFTSQDKFRVFQQRGIYCAAIILNMIEMIWMALLKNAHCPVDFEIDKLFETRAEMCVSHQSVRLYETKTKQGNFIIRTDKQIFSTCLFHYRIGTCIKMLSMWMGRRASKRASERQKRLDSGSNCAWFRIWCSSWWAKRFENVDIAEAFKCDSL